MNVQPAAEGYADPNSARQATTTQRQTEMHMVPQMATEEPPPKIVMVSAVAAKAHDPGSTIACAQSDHRPYLSPSWPSESVRCRPPTSTSSSGFPLSTLVVDIPFSVTFSRDMLADRVLVSWRKACGSQPQCCPRTTGASRAGGEIYTPL